MPHSLLLLPAEQSACAQCDAHELLALRLLEERGRGAASPWSAYLALLPAAPRTSASLSDADAELLSGTYAGVIVSGVRRRIQRFVQRARGASAAAFTDSALQWAMGIVLSRSLVVGAPGRLAGRNVSHAHLYDTPFLAPGADLFNHSPEARVGWTLSAEGASSLRQLSPGNSVAERAPGSPSSPASPTPPSAAPVFAIVTLQAYPQAGVEVFNCYHDAAGNAHLLSHHGFTLRDNAFDSIALHIGVGGWFGLVTAGLEEARRGVSARLRGLRERGLVSDGDVDAVVRWADPLALASPNVTVLLHAGGGGKPPLALLNIARMSVLTSTGPLAAWMDGSSSSSSSRRGSSSGDGSGDGSTGSAPTALSTSADASRVKSSIAAQAEKALWARLVKFLPEGAQEGGGESASALSISAGSGASAPLAVQHSPRGEGGVDTGHLLSLPLPVSLATDALAHAMLLNALAGLRRLYRVRATRMEGGVGGQDEPGMTGDDDADLAFVRQSILDVERACVDNGAGTVGLGGSSHSSGAASGGQSRAGIDSAAAAAAAAPAALLTGAFAEEAAAAPPSPTAAARALAPKATPLPLARARAAAEQAAKRLAGLEQRAAVLALRVSERKVLAQIIAQLLESYGGIVQQLQRTTGGGAFLEPLLTLDDGEASSALGTLELALAYAEGHADGDEAGVDGAGAGAGATPPAPASDGHGHLRREDAAGSHRGEHVRKEI